MSTSGSACIAVQESMRSLRLMSSFSQNFKVQFCEISSLKLVVNSIEFSPKPILGGGIQHLSSDSRHRRRPDIYRQEENSYTLKLTSMINCSYAGGDELLEQVPVIDQQNNLINDTVET